MAIDFHALQTNEADILIEAGSETATVTFRPGLITPERLEQLGKKIDSDSESSDLRETCLLLDELIVGWNIVNQGQPYAPTFENIYRLPIDVVGQLTDKILESSTEGHEAGKA